MIVAQIIKVIPGGDKFEIFDDHDLVLWGTRSTVEPLPIFETVEDDLKYIKAYSSFHVEKVDKVKNVWEIIVR